MNDTAEKLPMPQPQVAEKKTRGREPKRLTPEEIQVGKALVEAALAKSFSPEAGNQRGQEIIANNPELVEGWKNLSERAKELVIAEFVAATTLSETGGIRDFTDTSELFADREEEWTEIVNQIRPEAKDSLTDPSFATGLESIVFARNWLAKASQEGIQPNLWRALAGYAVAGSQIGDKLGEDCQKAFQFLITPANSPGSPLEETIIKIQSAKIG